MSLYQLVKQLLIRGIIRQGYSMIKQSRLQENSYVYIYQNQPKHPKFGVFIIHGMAEHGLRYQRFMEVLEKQDILAITMDLRGHGKSLRPTQEVGILNKSDDFHNILDDIYDAIKDAQKKHPEVHWTLMGHSMGSIFARAFALKYKNTVDKMIWMGTLPYFSRFKIKLIRRLIGFVSLFYSHPKRNQILSFLLNHPLEKKYPGGAFHWLSKNPLNVDDYISDPLSGYVYNSTFYQWFFKLIEEVNQPKAFQDTLLKSVAIIAGTGDPVIGSTEKIKELMSYYKDVKTSYYFVPQARHEVLNEGLSEVDDWLMEVIKDER